jgi:anti-sigma factor RsiW
MRWELLNRYLAGECTIAERAYVERWLAESPVRQELLEQFTKPNPMATDAQKAEIRARLERELGPELKLGGNGV